MRASLNARGVKTIRGMGRAFRIMDDNGDRKVDKQEFYWGLKDLGATCTKREAMILLEALDTNQDGVVSYDEFLYGIRGMPNEKRMEVIHAAFCKFDKTGDGVITTADLRVAYNAEEHPKVQAGEKTPEEVFTEFLACFGDVNGDGQITKAEWCDYYASVSANIDDDDHFCLLMANAWKL